MNQVEIKNQIIDALRNSTEEYLKANNPLRKGQVYSEIEKIEGIANPILEPEIDTVELVTNGEIKVNGRIEVEVREKWGDGNSRRARLELHFRDVVLNYSKEVISLIEGSFNVWSLEKRN